MPTSINGWDVLDDPAWSDPRITRAKVPGYETWVLLRKDVAPLFLALVKELYDTIKPPTTRITEGYDYRPARAGGGAWSDHSSGTAVDLWPDSIGAHTWPPRMDAATAAKIVPIVKKYGVILWGAHTSLGGSYTQERNNDPMHFALKRDTSLADVKAVIAKLGIQPDGTVKTAGQATGVHVVRTGGRTALARAEVVRQSGMSVERFNRFNPKCPDPVPAGTPVRVPLSVTAIYPGRDRAPKQ
jgi:hypothetical protein